MDLVYSPTMSEPDEKHTVDQIIAIKSLSLSEWNKLGSSINTTEIDKGSRWIQEPTTAHDIQSYYGNQERYLIKWSGLSYLHCSWETKEDLLELCTNGEECFAQFEERTVDGFLYRGDERKDGASLV